jgi:asparagine synthase (glutamine-hydrolysing)
VCGIAGAIHFPQDPVEPTIVQKMGNKLSHRGPDSSGYYVANNVGLSHRRLSIIDTSSAGKQPMLSNCEQYVISYNGEIYNFKEIRETLGELGYRFKTGTDTEVVLAAFQEWKEECLSRFNGMFAIAIFDVDNRNIFLARDRYGVKPLYYYIGEKCFLFGSEIKAFSMHPYYSVGLDKAALLEYFTFQNTFTERTLFSGASLLAAGSFMNISTENYFQNKITKFWDFNFTRSSAVRTHSQYVEELEHLFTQAVRRQLVSDVPVGSYLSSGIDSSAITAVAKANYPALNSFTIGFDTSMSSVLEAGFDERTAARTTAETLGTNHHESVLVSGDMERCLPLLTYHIEEPRVGQSYPNYYAAKLASSSCKVVLSGTGGDEIFAGYPWRYYRALQSNSFDNYIDNYYQFWQRLVPNSILKKLFAPIWNDVKDVWTRDIFRDVFKGHDISLDGPEDYVNHSLYFEAKTFLNGLLVVEDKLSMAHSLETRVPFLDNDLVDFASRIPVDMKLRNIAEVVRINENEPLKASQFFQRSNDGKIILRQALSELLPENLTSKVKQGFSGPDATWFREQSIKMVANIVDNDKSRIYEFFDKQTVRDLIAEHMSGKVNRRLFIWSLLHFENWCINFLP